MATNLKLGKRQTRIDPRTLVGAKYLRALPPPPAAVDWSAAAGQLGMMGNDRLGDCTCAGLAHMIQVWTGNANPPAKVWTDDQVVAAYSQLCGYDPANPASDQGGVELDILNAWRTSGVNGDKIVAYVSLDPKNATELQQAIALFGGIYTGIALPTSAQQQTIWDTTPSSPSDAGTWGGHCVPLVGYYPATQGNWFHRMLGEQATKGGAVCITWGATKKLTWDFIADYMDEAYAVLTQDWIEANGKSPSGFDLATLQADLAAVTA